MHPFILFLKDLIFIEHAGHSFIILSSIILFHLPLYYIVAYLAYFFLPSIYAQIINFFPFADFIHLYFSLLFSPAAFS